MNEKIWNEKQTSQIYGHDSIQKTLDVDATNLAKRTTDQKK